MPVHCEGCALTLSPDLNRPTLKDNANSWVEHQAPPKDKTMANSI